MGMNIASVMGGNMSVNGGIDQEHLRIMRELRAMGIEPTGNKSTDKAKLEEAKKVKNIQQANIAKHKNNEDNNYQGALNFKDQPQLDYNMSGATQISDMNKLFILKKVV